MFLTISMSESGKISNGEKKRSRKLLYRVEHHTFRIIEGAAESVEGTLVARRPACPPARTRPHWFAIICFPSLGIFSHFTVSLENTHVENSIVKKGRNLISRYQARIQPIFSNVNIFLLWACLFSGLNATEYDVAEELDSTTSSLASNLRKAYTNDWAIRIADGNDEEAERLATKYGYQNLGRWSNVTMPSKWFRDQSSLRHKIIPGEDYFLFRNVNQRTRSSRKSRSLQLKRISHDPEKILNKIEKCIAYDDCLRTLWHKY
ncbi:hypothetical protein DICVIV_00574 [Dictyocaulus viviparus]|uniref:Peptidase S8 pro-domain domain-containing protein n=1 Tax=Dictyocaulus viviparus TaxID=29172 RepID=A0A0D8Y8W5_DICVI|nr:hypothetical protein DICVIV_00574 [Dictyocaulus viviparus]